MSVKTENWEGYREIETIFLDQSIRIFRAEVLDSGEIVRLKTHASAYPDFEAIYRIKNDFNTGNLVTGPGFPKYKKLVKIGNRYSIEMDDFIGISLKEFMKSGPPGLEIFIAIATQLTDALSKLHHSGFIHRDIKPGNILIDPKMLKIQLIDFGLAKRFNYKSVSEDSKSSPEGTLHYISPEQTGRMNRPTTVRSDFYSLGIVFFEMLTGRLPFQTEDPMEMVFSHIAKKPPLVKTLNPQIPWILSALIDKLLSKDASDRYKTARGIKYDLKEIDANEPEKTLVLGQHDFSQVFEIKNKLYGREEAYRRLENTINEIKSGSFELMMISGYSGIGKTSLINELLPYLAQENIFYSSGKFEQFGKNKPFQAILNCLDVLFKQILASPTEQINRWKEKFQSLLGTNAQIIIDLIPSLAHITGEQKPFENLAAKESEIRLHHLFLQLFRSFSNEEHPMVFFLDDLQWADAATLKFLGLLSLDSDLTHLLIIGAYRDNEVNENHPLSLKLNNIQSKRIIHQITLSNIPKYEIGNLLSENFGFDSEELCELVYAKTQGNPFFVIQFLNELFEKKLLVPSIKEKKWKASLEKIKNLNITSNVVDLMIENIKDLEQETRNVIEIASCFGITFSMRKLFWNMGSSVSSISVALTKALDVKLIRPKNDQFNQLLLFYKEDFTQDEFEALLNLEFNFVHDKIQQAAYNLTKAENKAFIYLNTAKKMIENKAVYLPENLFEIVNYLNASQHLQDESISDQAIDLNLLAAEKALNAGEYFLALDYLTISEQKYGLEAYSIFPELVFKTMFLKSTAWYLSGKNQLSLKLANTIISKTGDKNQLLDCYLLVVNILTRLDLKNEAIEAGRKALGIFGIYFPMESNRIKLNLAREMVIGMITASRLGYKGIANLPAIQNPELKKLCNFMLVLQSSTYQSHPELWLLLLLKSQKIMYKKGISEAAPAFIMGLGILKSFMLGDKSAAYRYGKLSMAITEKYYPESKIYFSSYLFSNFCHHWGEDVESVIDDLIDIYNGNMQKGELVYAGYSLSQRTFKKMYIGTSLEELYKETKQYLLLMEEQGDRENFNFMISRAFTLFGLLGYPENENLESRISNNINEKIKELEKNKSYTILSILYLSQFQLAVIQDQTEDKVSLALSYFPMVSFLIGLVLLPEANLYPLLVLTRQFENGNEKQKKSYKKAGKKYLANLKKCSDIHPENFLACYLIGKAEWFRVTGNAENALIIFEEAISQASQNHFQNFEALANELKARCLISMDRTKAARTYLVDAYYHYLNWGAKIKARQLFETYQSLIADFIQPNLLLSPQLSFSSDGSYDLGGDQFDIMSILKASRAISQEIKLDDLMSTMLHLLIQNLGAQRAVLLLCEKDEFKIKAEANLEQSGFNFDFTHQHILDSLPINILNYVNRTDEILILNKPIDDKIFGRDKYIKEYNPLSILCFPLVNQKSKIGLIYMENYLIERAFTETRAKVVSILSGQMAISLENSLLYLNLENKVNERTEELQIEKKKSDTLLLNILPEETAEELKAFGKTKARRFEEATVLFADICKFTQFASIVEPEELVAELDEYFRFFDDIMDKYKLEKIKTIGDAYMAAGGLNERGPEDGVAVINAAIEIQKYAKEKSKVNISKGYQALEFRIGIHSGPVVAGVVGKNKFQYDIWGDTVNTAARMEQNSQPGKINISQSTFNLIRHQFKCEPRGAIQAKYKGEIHMFFIEIP